MYVWNEIWHIQVWKLTIALMHTYKLMSIICYIIKSDVATEMLLMSLN